MLFLGSISLSPTAPAQTTYTFTKIADTNIFSSPLLTRPSLNDEGAVAFIATASDGGHGVFVGRGGENELSDYTAIALNQPPVVVTGLGSYVGSHVAYAVVATNATPRLSIFSSDGFTPQLILGGLGVGQQGSSFPILMNRLGQIAPSLAPKRFR